VRLRGLEFCRITRLLNNWLQLGPRWVTLWDEYIWTNDRLRVWIRLPLLLLLLVIALVVLVIRVHGRRKASP